MSLITAVIQRYYPTWDPPPDYRDWNRTLCPFHGESTPSAAVNYGLNAFNCLACDVKGDAVSIIRHEEGVSYAEAFRIAESLLVGSDYQVSGEPPRKPRLRVPGKSRHPAGDAVRAGIRGRPTPWS